MNTQTTTIWQLPKISPLKQREGFYCKESMSHPAKMPTYLAAAVISTYTRPGDWVVDPMSGTGTTGIEARKLGRNAIGVEYEKTFFNLCNKNLKLTEEKLGNANSKAFFIHGDARQLSALLSKQGKMDAIIFSPPYENVLCKQKGNSSALCKKVFGYMVPYSEEKATKENRGEVNIGLQKGDAYLGEMFKVYKECHSVLKPDGLMILVVRNFRRKGEEIDLRTNTIHLCKMAGFKFFQTCMHILNEISFWQKINTKKVPFLMLNTTEYVLVFKK